MTREEEIMQHALNYSEKIDYDLWLDTEHPKSYVKMLVMAAAEDNAKWADEHLKNQWRIFPKDIPNDGQEVILTWKKSGTILKALFQKEFVTARGKLVKNIFRLEHEECKGLYSNIRWHDESSVTFWMSIPELPEGGKQ